MCLKNVFLLCFNLLSTVIEWGGGWGFISHFPINWMLRSFKCIEISLSDQTPGVSGPMRAQLVLCSALIGPNTNHIVGVILKTFLFHLK